MGCSSNSNTLRTAVNTYVYDGYGDFLGGLHVGTGALTGYNQDPVQFGGQYGYYQDPETGLYQLGARYYDAGKGRFVNRDPIGYAGGANLYGFCGNNPVNESDPSGDDPSCKLTTDEYNQIQAGIEFLGHEGHLKEADVLEKMLREGRIRTDTSTDPDDVGTYAVTSLDPTITAANVEIDIFPKRYDSTYSRDTPTQKWASDLNVSATLLHEYQHAYNQGDAYQYFHNYEREDRAYGVELRYLQAVRARYSASQYASKHSKGFNIYVKDIEQRMYEMHLGKAPTASAITIYPVYPERTLLN